MSEWIGGHLSDGRLVAFSDGALGGIGRIIAKRHVESCGDCAQRLRMMRSSDEALRSLLTATVVRLPDEWVASAARLASGQLHSSNRRGTSLQRRLIAAALVGALGLGLIASPAVAAAARWIRELISTQVPASESTPAPASAVRHPDASRPTGTVIRFVPGQPVLALSFAVPDSGLLELSRHREPEVVFESVATAEIPILVQPSGLAISNRPRDRGASFKVTVPPSVTRVEVMVAGRTVRIVQTDSLDHGVARRIGLTP